MAASMAYFVFGLALTSMCINIVKVSWAAAGESSRCAPPDRRLFWARLSPGQMAPLDAPPPHKEPAIVSQ